MGLTRRQVLAGLGWFFLPILLGGLGWLGWRLYQDAQFCARLAAFDEPGAIEAYLKRDWETLRQPGHARLFWRTLSELPIERKRLWAVPMFYAPFDMALTADRSRAPRPLPFTRATEKFVRAIVEDYAARLEAGTAPAYRYDGPYQMALCIIDEFYLDEPVSENLHSAVRRVWTALGEEGQRETGDGRNTAMYLICIGDELERPTLERIIERVRTNGDWRDDGCLPMLQLGLATPPPDVAPRAWRRAQVRQYVQEWQAREAERKRQQR